MKKILFLFIIAVFASFSTVRAQYVIFSYSGDIDISADRQDWKKASKRDTITTQHYLRLVKDSKVSVVDTRSNCIYKFETPGITSLADIVTTAKEKSSKVFKNTNAELAKQLRDNKSRTLQYGVTGSTVREVETGGYSFEEQLYSTICAIVEGSINAESKQLAIKKKRTGKKQFQFIVSNNTEDDLLLNMCSFRKEKPDRKINLCIDYSDEFIFDSGIIIPAGCSVNIDYQTFQKSNNLKYLFFATSRQFSVVDLRDLINSGIANKAPTTDIITTVR